MPQKESKIMAQALASLELNAWQLALITEETKQFLWNVKRIIGASLQIYSMERPWKKLKTLNTRAEVFSFSEAVGVNLTTQVKLLEESVRAATSVDVRRHAERAEI